MRSLKIKATTIIIFICSIFIIGCSKEEIVSNEVSSNNSILDTVQDKYYIHLPDEKEDGTTALGMIFYFNDEKVELSFLPADDFNNDEFRYISTEIGEDFIKYNIEEDFITYTSQDGSQAQKPEGYVKITKDENNNLKLESPWILTSNLNLVDKEECTKVINDKFSLIKVEDFIEEFNQKFNLNIELLEDASNNDATNSNLQIETDEFTVEDAIDILQANGYFIGRDYEYVKGNCLSRDISTNEIICEENKGIKYYSFWIDHVATDVLENGSILTALDEWWYE